MKQLSDTDLMPFGMHKDKPMLDVPAKYLHYLWNDGLHCEVKSSSVADYISRNMESLADEYKDGIWAREK